MAVFTTRVTDQAKSEQAIAIANNKPLIFTKLRANGQELKELKISNQAAGQVEISGKYSNENATTSFKINRLDLMAKVDGRSEFVFATSTSADGDTVPSKNDQPFIVVYRMTVAVNNQANIGLSYKVDQNTLGKFIQQIGNAKDKVFTISHGLNERYPLVQVTSTIDPWDVVQVTTVIKNSNQINLEFADIQKVNEFAVTIIG
ncbi:hypothetical protein DBT36_04080 [Aerococcus mictus]|uniref:hypothetical protein n=1 Tax=Aerococcus mictus TaxID=2976810 RepID=UPI000DCE4C10|nr:hypothetical protein [Aerococcus mictus]RAV85686.1 hypothetical protein DBT36_04080 [Aerococcus mictus]